MNKMLKRIQNDIVSAMKNKDTVRKDQLKLVLAKAQSIAKEETREVTDADVNLALTKEVKQTKQAITMLEESGKTNSEFYQKNVTNLEILQSYLPKQLSEKELELAVKDLLSNIDTSNRGLVMKTVMSALKEKADGKAINAVVTKLLQS